MNTERTGARAALPDPHGDPLHVVLLCRLPQDAQNTLADRHQKTSQHVRYLVFLVIRDIQFGNICTCIF